jgi:hypothetical protein
LDIPGQIRQAIVEFIAWVAETGLKPVLKALGDTVLATPALTGIRQVRAVWTTSLVAANAIFVLLIVAGAFIVASRETLQSQYGFKQILPRLIVAAVASNLSLLVCGKAIAFTNALTATLAGQGLDGAAAAAALTQTIDKAGQGTSFLLSLLAIAVLVMALVVVITFIGRIALLVLLIGVAPLALVCHATPQTEGLAYAWWRALAACLALQVGQTVILVATLKVFLTPAGPTVLGIPSTSNGLLGLLVCATMLWLLIKLPGWMRHFVLGSLSHHGGRGLVGQVLHAYLTFKTLVAVAGVAAGHRSAGHRTGRRPPPTTGPGPTGQPSRPLPSSPRTPGPRPRSAGPAAGTPRSSTTRAAGTSTVAHVPWQATSHGVPATGGTGPVRFSHAPTHHTPRRAPAEPATPVRFSDARPPQEPPARPAGPPPPAEFSSARRPTAARPATPTRSATAPRHVPVEPSTPRPVRRGLDTGPAGTAPHRSGRSDRRESS